MTNINVKEQSWEIGAEEIVQRLGAFALAVDPGVIPGSINNICSIFLL